MAKYIYMYILYIITILKAYNWATFSSFECIPFISSTCVFSDVDELISSSEWNKSGSPIKKASLEPPELACTRPLGSKDKEVSALER